MTNSAANSQRSLMLLGNPNCGKTTFFNALTGGHQRVGNWPGVTVEKKIGKVLIDDQPFEIIDLPGVYSLNSSIGSLDEEIALKAVLSSEADIIINIIDASHLERHLYLTSQLLELEKPMIVVLNMFDVAKLQGISIDVIKLSHLLKCPVLPIQAHKSIGLEALKKVILQRLEPSKPLTIPIPQSLETELQQLANQASFFTAFRTLEIGTNTDIIIADARYRCIHEIVLQVQTKTADASENFTAKLDRIILHRFLGLPIFFSLMYLMFFGAIKIGGAFQDFFDLGTEAIFVQGFKALLESLHSPAWIIAIFAGGLGKGINTTLTFIPVLGAMYFILAFFEASGYMARAAFVMDKLMRILGLPGKAFVPLIVGFGCNVPAIMATRTLDSEKDRILTILISPFMSCSARLAIYAVFVAAFFPTGGQNIVFSLYLIGLLVAILTGVLLKKSLLKGPSAPLVLELPTYHLPSWHRLYKETLIRLRVFIVRAGKFIIPIAMCLGILNTLTIHGNFVSNGSSESILALIGRWLTPFFYPLGIHDDNWPATVSLLSGMLAKEVVIGSLNTLYAQATDLTLTAGSILHLLKLALISIPQNLSELFLMHGSNNPQELTQGVYGTMVKYFDGKVGAYAYLLFILLYIPCLSTMAVIKQETNQKLMWLSIGWSFLVAYATAVVFYQLATIIQHPLQSILWIIGLSILVLVNIKFIFNSNYKMSIYHAVTNS